MEAYKTDIDKKAACFRDKRLRLFAKIKADQLEQDALNTDAVQSVEVEIRHYEAMSPDTVSILAGQTRKRTLSAGNADRPNREY